MNSFEEDLVSNALLGLVLVALMAARDLCKRISHSDCAIDSEHGLMFKLPTFRAPTNEVNI